MASAYAKLEDYDNAKTYFEKSLTEHRTSETVSKLSDVEKILRGRCRVKVSEFPGSEPDLRSLMV